MALNFGIKGMIIKINIWEKIGDISLMAYNKLNFDKPFIVLFCSTGIFFNMILCLRVSLVSLW